MKEIEEVTKKLTELIKWLDKELKSTNFSQYITTNGGFTSYATKDIKSTFFSVLNNLKEIRTSILKGEDIKHIERLTYDICVDKRNQLIEKNKDTQGTQTPDNEEKYNFFSNLTSLINVIEENLSEIYEKLSISYDIYYHREEKQETKKSFWLEKLLVPIIILLIGAIISWYFKTQLTDIKKNQERQIQLQTIQQKFQIKDKLSSLLHNIKNQINNIKFATDNMSSLLNLTNKSNLTKVEINSFKIQMEAMKKSFVLAGENKNIINSLLPEIQKQLEIYDIYNQTKISKKFQSISTHINNIDESLLSQIKPLYDKLIINFIKSVKKGKILTFGTEKDLKLINKKLHLIESSIKKANVDFNKLKNEIIQLHNQLEK